jgi:CheY-like chemotaxis protein
VLVVDDDPDNLDAMRLVLAQRGQRVDTTPSGLDAVARVEGGERYDTVVCDLGLGDLGGWDVAERIGTVAPATRILILTGWAQEIAPGDPRRRHVERVLAKPLEAQDLEDIVRGPAPPAPPGPASPPVGEASPG